MANICKVDLELKDDEDENLNSTQVEEKPFLNCNGLDDSSCTILKSLKNGVVNNIGVLSLSGQGLESLALDIEHLRNVFEIDLSNNKLNYLPPEFGQLKSLIHLNLSHNQFVSIPFSIIVDFYNIAHLDLSFNSITSFRLPPLCLPFLIYLNLRCNELSSIPLWLSEEAASKLEFLDLSMNPCFTEAIPKDFFRMSSNRIISCIRTLKLASTGFNQGHMQILRGFTCLSSLDIGIENTYSKRTNKNVCELNVQVLQTLPLEELHAKGSSLPEIPNDINRLVHLRVFNCSSNHLLLWFPESVCQLSLLTVLDASDCSLITLPENIGALRSLQKLWLSKNEICVLPNSISKITSLEIVDLYHNNFEIVPTILDSWKGFDIGHNFCDPLQFYEECRYTALRDYLRQVVSSDDRDDTVREPLSYESDDDDQMSRESSRFSEYTSSGEESERRFNELEPEISISLTEDKWELNDDYDDMFDPNLACSRRESANSIELLQRSLCLQNGYYHENYETQKFYGSSVINHLSDEEDQFEDAD